MPNMWVMHKELDSGEPEVYNGALFKCVLGLSMTGVKHFQSGRTKFFTQFYFSAFFNVKDHISNKNNLNRTNKNTQM